MNEEDFPLKDIIPKTEQVNNQDKKNGFRGPEQHRFDKEEMAKGGRNNSPEVQAWKRIKHCNERCPYHSSCAWISVSQSSEMKGFCALKKGFPLRLQRSFLRVLSGKEAEFDAELNAIFTEFLLGKGGTEPDPKDKILVGIKLKDALFGRKVRSEISGELKTDNINREIEGLQESYEKQLKENAAKKAAVENAGNP